MNFSCEVVESFSEFSISVSKIFPEFAMVQHCLKTPLSKFELIEPTRYKT
jgi:hypothetical protein